MSKETIIRVLCDNHEAGYEVFGREVVVAFGGGDRPRAIDLCEECEKELVSPLRDLLDELGQPVLGPLVVPKKPKKKPKKSSNATKIGVYVCPVPGCNNPRTGKPNAHGTRATLNSHVLSVHDIGLGAVEALYGIQTGDGDPALLPIRCPSCEQRFSTVQGLALHGQRSHDSG